MSTNHQNLIDLTGNKYGRLLVVSRAPNAKRYRTQWNCICECGNQKIVAGANLVAKSTISCGCHRKEKIKTAVTTHGLSKTPEYAVWVGMLARCYNPNRRSFKDYGARGVKVHAQWKEDFSEFFGCVGPRPSKSHSLDRYPNNDGNYEPGNVRWATRKEQGRNNRRNRIVEVRGVRMPLVVAAEKYSIPYQRVLSRLKQGWPLLRALDLLQ